MKFRTNIPVVFSFVLILCWNTISLAQNNQNDYSLNNLPEENVTQVQIDSVFSFFNTFDYIRGNSSKEETIKWLIKHCEELNYQVGIAKARNLLGVLLRDQSQYEEAIKLHEAALKIAGDDTITQIFSYNDLGVAYRRLDKPRIALDYHLKALDLSEKFKGDPLVAQRSACVALNSIGNINLTLDQPEQAFVMFKESLEREKALHNELGIAINLQNIGYAYQAMGIIDSALTYFYQSLSYNEKINSMVGRSICLNSIGDVFLQKKQFIEALKYFNLAMIFAEKTNDDFYISQTHANLGKTFLQLNRLDLAFSELMKYNELATKINSGSLITDSYKLLSDYYEKLGNYQVALENYKKSVVYNDSVVNEKNTKYLNELQTIYEAKKKEQQIDLLTAENEIKTQRSVMLLIIISGILIMAGLIYFFLSKKAEQQKTELKLKLLRSQMDPHFIFNALGSIQSFMYQNEPVKAASYLGQFSTLTRSILKNSNKELITLGEELETLKNYIEIERMRKRDCFDYELLLDENIEADFVYVPPVFLQPFVENSIQHGFSVKGFSSGLITVHIIQLPKSINITITDNGQGINASLTHATRGPYHSMATKIFKERIRLIERKYKKTVNFEIVDRSEKDPDMTGTTVIINFPLIEPDDKNSNY